MPPGRCGPVAQRAARLRETRIRCAGGCTFAEDPSIDALGARIIWHAGLDPGTIVVAAEPASSHDADSFDPSRLRRWLSVAVDPEGREHAVLSDGLRRIRLDVETGSLRLGEPVLLRYRLEGIAGASSQLLPLRRFLMLCRRGTFAASLFPPDPRTGRWLEALRVDDALTDGASQREIAIVLVGRERVEKDWTGPADSLRSRVRRLVKEARAMTGGGYRRLMRRR